MSTRLTASVALLMTIAVGGLFAETEVRITANLARDFAEKPSVSDTSGAFSSSDPANFWGPGWEVIIDNLGLGGDYMVSFQKQATGDWWLDWYSEPIFVSYHFFGAFAFVDPFVRLSLGSAGRVWLQSEDPVVGDRLYVSLFPAASVGLSVGLEHFVVGGKMTWFPSVSPPPATRLQEYPLGNFQVALFAGVSLGGRRGPHRHGD
jgi:hypothetical protein